MRKSRKLRKPVKPYADSTLETGLKKADLINHIKRLQTEWAPVYHAHWIYKADAWHCSRCGCIPGLDKTKYCGSCHAVMDEGE